MTFNFIDKIQHLDPQKYALGSKQISLKDQPYLIKNTHLYPCMLVESVGQLCAWLVMATAGFDKRPVATLYRKLEFFDDASVGDILTVETTLKSLDAATSLFDGQVSCGEKILATVSDAAGYFLPMENFSSITAVKEEFDNLCNFHQRESSNYEILRFAQNDRVAQNDRIAENNKEKINLEYDKIEPVTPLHYRGYKNFDAYNHFFAYHFPYKPVLPISILLQTKINLIKKILCENKQLLPLNALDKFANLSDRDFTISSVKIREFTPPEKTIVTELKFNFMGNSKILIKTFCTIENKKICSADFEIFSRLA